MTDFNEHDGLDWKDMASTGSVSAEEFELGGECMSLFSLRSVYKMVLKTPSLRLFHTAPAGKL